MLQTRRGLEWRVLSGSVRVEVDKWINPMNQLFKYEQRP